jgi:negative regulator of replication initiation
MKTLTVDDTLYSAIEAEAAKCGRPVNDLIAEAIEAWLSETEMDDEERSEIATARIEAAEQGGVEFEEFFDDLLGDTD